MDDFMLGEIVLMALPNYSELSNFKKCNGQSIPFQGNEILYSLLYAPGGTPGASFTLPDLTDKIPVAGLDWFICTTGAAPTYAR